MADITHIAGVALRDENGRYLLVQEGRPDVRGLWNWPAGHVDPGETLEQAAVREAKEETNLDVSITGSGPVHMEPSERDANHLLHLFRGEVAGGKLKHQAGEILDARWFSADEIRKMDKDGKTRSGWVAAGVNKIEGGP